MSWPIAVVISVGIISMTVLLYAICRYTIPAVMDCIGTYFERRYDAYVLGVKPLEENDG